TYYLGAAIYLLDYGQTGSRASVRLAGLLGGCLPWVKQEGWVLWLCLLLLASWATLRRRDRGTRRSWGALLPLVLPGGLVLIGWQLFVRGLGAPSEFDFLPLTAATLASNLGRAPTIAAALAGELANSTRWSVLWPALAAALWALAADYRARLAAPL